MVLCGIEAHVELFGDLSVGTTLEYEGEVFLLFGGEPGSVGVLFEVRRTT
jgi:hypothetical protein